MGYEQPALRRRLIPLTILLSCCASGSLLAESAQGSSGITPASGYCAEAGEATTTRRRPGVPVEEYQLPACEDEEEEGRIEHGLTPSTSDLWFQTAGE